MSGSREKDFGEDAGQDVIGLDGRGQFGMTLESDIGIIAFLLTPLDLAEIVVPACGDVFFDAGSFEGAQEEQLAVELEDRDARVGTDGGVDAGTGFV